MNQTPTLITKHTLFIVANRAGARFVLRDLRGRFHAIEEIDFPQGKLRDREIDSDRPGRTHDSQGSRHALSHHVSPHEHVAEELAREIAKRAREMRLEDRYNELVLVAEPGFLGVLRSAIDEPTAKLMAEAIHHDLAALPIHDLEKHLTRA
jgi:protein required for attachment to host cells